MLQISSDLVDAMVAHAGPTTLMRPAGYWLAPRAAVSRPDFVPMLNAARSPTFCGEFDSHDLLALCRDLDDRDEGAGGDLPLHTATEAYPSRTDIAYASEPGAHYVVISTRRPARNRALRIAFFRIIDGQVLEEEVSVVGAD